MKKQKTLLKILKNKRCLLFRNANRMLKLYPLDQLLKPSYVVVNIYQF